MKRAFAAVIIALALCATDAAAQCAVKRVKFERGSTTAALRGKVSASRAVCYELRARAGQKMSVRLTSTSKTVRFVVTPPGFDREPIVSKVTNWEGVLQEDGDHSISITVPKGSDFYSLEVTVQ